MTRRMNALLATVFLIGTSPAFAVGDPGVQITRPAGYKPTVGDAKLDENLFNDTKLSSNGMSCASCHANHGAFSDSFAKPCQPRPSGRRQLLQRGERLRRSRPVSCRPAHRHLSGGRLTLSRCKLPSKRDREIATFIAKKGSKATKEESAFGMQVYKAEQAGWTCQQTVVDSMRLSVLPSEVPYVQWKDFK